MKQPSYIASLEKEIDRLNARVKELEDSRWSIGKLILWLLFVFIIAVIIDA